jgi:hypothetical protein
MRHQGHDILLMAHNEISPTPFLPWIPWAATLISRSMGARHSTFLLFRVSWVFNPWFAQQRASSC